MSIALGIDNENIIKRSSSNMRQPHKITKSFLKQHQEEGSSTIGISSTCINPNPTLKKYYYWIYHYNMPYASAHEVFFKDEHKLSLKKAMDLMYKLEKDSISFAYVSIGYHRLGTKIFNYEKLKEKYPDIKFAVAYSEDRDEVYEELNGHK
jgi:hypothetical protein